MFVQFRSGLFRRIFAATTALAVFIMAAAMILSSMEYAERIRAETALRHGYMTQHMSMEIANFFHRSRGQMEVLAGFLKYTGLQEHELKAILNQISLNMPHLMELTVTGPSGPHDEIPATRVDLDVNRIPRMEPSVPVIYRGSTVQVVKARLSLKHLWLWVDELNKDPATNLIIVKTGSGLVIADQSKKLIGAIYPGFPGSASGAGESPSGQPVYLSRYDLPGLDLTIIASSAIPAPGAYIYQARYRLLALTLGLTVLAAFLSYLFSVRAVRPVNILTEAMTRYAEKGGRITEPLEGEYKNIADAFNHVAETLEANRKALVAQESLVTLGRVAAILSHELRHGLQAISAEAHMLDAEPENKRRLNRIVANLVSQVSGIMELARGSQVDAAPTEAGAILDESRDILALNGFSKGVNVSIETDGRGQVWLMADKRKVIAAISNLVRNSVDAKASNVRLEARLEGSMAALIVSDDGDGFDPAIVGKIMEPFVTTKEKGYGLGLTFVNSVAIAHGGRFTLDGGPGRGCVARIFLPVKAPEKKE